MPKWGGHGRVEVFQRDKSKTTGPRPNRYGRVDAFTPTSAEKKFAVTVMADDGKAAREKHKKQRK